MVCTQTLARAGLALSTLVFGLGLASLVACGGDGDGDDDDDDDDDDDLVIDASVVDATATDAAVTADASASGLVVDLDDPARIEFCEAFYAQVCVDGGGKAAELCAGCSVEVFCSDAAVIGQQCAAPITTAAVEECAATIDFEVCTTGGGGCMFDVGDLQCD